MRVTKHLDVDKHTSQTCFQLHTMGQPFPWSQSVFDDMTRPPYAIYTATDNGAGIIGYALTLTVVDEVTLMDIVVHLQHRQSGVGQALLEAMFTDATQLKMAKILLEVRESNLAAKMLYHRLGFDTVAVRKGYYRDAQDQDKKENALIMEKRLLPNR